MHTEFLNVGGGIIGFLLLILDIIVILEVLYSNRTISKKVGWSLLVFLFPLAGLIVYLLCAHREEHRMYMRAECVEEDVERNAVDNGAGVDINSPVPGTLSGAIRENGNNYQA